MTNFRIGDEKVNFASKHQQELLDALKTAKLQKERMPFSQIFKLSAVVIESLCYFLTTISTFKELMLPNTSLINNALYRLRYSCSVELPCLTGHSHKIRLNKKKKRFVRSYFFYCTDSKRKMLSKINIAKCINLIRQAPLNEKKTEYVFE